jgi:hypothetical protein
VQIRPLSSWRGRRGPQHGPTGSQRKKLHCIHCLRRSQKNSCTISAVPQIFHRGFRHPAPVDAHLVGDHFVALLRFSVFSAAGSLESASSKTALDEIMCKCFLLGSESGISPPQIQFICCIYCDNVNFVRMVTSRNIVGGSIPHSIGGPSRPTLRRWSLWSGPVGLLSGRFPELDNIYSPWI